MKETPAGKPAAPARHKKTGGTLSLRQVKSGICAQKDQKATLSSLGFRKMGQRVVREDSPSIRGMVHKVRHLVEIEKD